MISCSCVEYAVSAVGSPRLVTCRQERPCHSCSEVIHPNDYMYIQSMYNWENSSPVAPVYLCEECGDLMLSIDEAGFCYTLSDIQGQWEECLNSKAEENE